MEQRIELRIGNMEDRLKVATILIKSGYTVSQKRRKLASGRAYEYYLEVAENDDNARTA